MKINYCETITEIEAVRLANRYFKLVSSRKHILCSKPVHGCLHHRKYVYTYIILYYIVHPGLKKKNLRKSCMTTRVCRDYSHWINNRQKKKTCFAKVRFPCTSH